MEEERPPLPEEPPFMEQSNFMGDLPEMKEPSPAPTAAPTPPPPASTGSQVNAGASWWRVLAEECKGRLPVMYRVFLDKCKGELANGTVIVYAPDEIVKGRLDNDRVLGVLQELGALKAGEPVSVRLTVGSGPAVSQEDKLQDLIQIGSQLDSFTIQ